MQLPENYAETPDGLLFIADGLSPMVFWDGLANATLPVGLAQPAAACALSAAGTGTITGTYYAFVRFVDVYGNASDLSPVSAAATAASNATLTFSSVPVPTSSKVVRRQLLRNTAGQATTFYVDVDTTDLTSTSFTSTQTDTALSAGFAVPLLDDSGKIFASSNGVPPTHKVALAHHLGRMFATCERSYLDGNVQVTNGSIVVRGVGTSWGTALAGRVLYVVGALASYTIASVDATAQTLTLTSAYQDSTDLCASYAIRPQAAERRLVYYSEAGRIQSWPVFNAISVQEDGDEISGLMVMGSFLYILEKRHIYRFTFQKDPALDGANFLAAIRGSINQKCWVIVEGTAYMLDESGIHAFNGSEEIEPISTPIQDLFIETSTQPLKINWQASDYFHAALYPADQIIRWFVCMSGDRYPRHAIAYDFRYKRWWLEEYSRPISASCTSTYRGHRKVFLGSSSKQTFLHADGALDGIDPTGGTVRGTVSGASLYRLCDSLASFPAAGVVGNAVTIVSGKGKGQWREVVAVSGSTLILKTPWSVLPDTTSIYQLGGIRWSFQTGWYRWTDDEQENPRKVEVLFEPCALGNMTLQILKDFNTKPVVWRRTFAARSSEGFAVTAGSTELDCDLTRTSGFAQQRLNSSKEYQVDGWRHISLRFTGVGATDKQFLYEVSLDGVRGKRK